MPMHNPPHPGGVVRRQCLEPLRLSVTEAAEGLGVTRQALSELLNGKAGISVDMAIRASDVAEQVCTVHSTIVRALASIYSGTVVI